jgi:Family of unknown function (DUF6941)
MELDFALLADGVSHRPDGKLDIYGAGFDTVFAPAVPATHPRLVLVVRILLSRHEASHPGGHLVDVVLQAADGQELTRARGEVSPLNEEQQAQLPPGRQLGIGLVLNFENITFPGIRELSSCRKEGLMNDSLPQIEVDFNNSDEDGLVFARTVRVRGLRTLSQGEEVLAVDGEGHECHARVVRIQGELVFLDLDWDTWALREPETPARTSTGVSSGRIESVSGEVVGNGETATPSERSGNLIPA